MLPLEFEKGEWGECCIFTREATVFYRSDAALFGPGHYTPIQNN
jgi:hypothetical protein